MGYLSLESSSTRKVEKDIVNFAISIFVERKNTIEEAIKLVSDRYVALNNSFKGEFKDLVKIKKVPLISGTSSKKVEETIGNKVETKYVRDGYRASCIMILSFKLDDIRKSKLNISRIYDIVAEKSEVCSTIDYSITVSEEVMEAERKELQKELLKDARSQAENILIDETPPEELNLEEAFYHVEESNSRRYGSDMAFARRERAASNDSSESVMSPEAIKLLILEDIEPVTIMDTIVTKWIY